MVMYYRNVKGNFVPYIKGNETKQYEIFKRNKIQNKNSKNQEKKNVNWL